MRVLPSSLSGRLTFGGIVFTVVALLVTLLVMRGVFERFVTGQIDQRLDNKLVALASQVRVAPDGSISLDGNPDGPPFDQARHQSFWWVGGPRNARQSRWVRPGSFVPPSVSEIKAISASPAPALDHEPEVRAAPPPRTLRGSGPEGVAVYMRVMTRTIDGTPLTILAAAPRKAIDGPLREALGTLATAVVVLGGAMIVGGAWFGSLILRPIHQLSRDVAEVRVGRRSAVTSDQLSELRPLVDELNSLLVQNAENLVRARRHVANLAHGLKTPLATLSLGVGRLDSEDRKGLQPLVDTIDRRVRHHLGRARAAALDGPARARTLIDAKLRDVTDALTKIYADKRVAVAISCPVGATVACEPQDVDEMLGNLLENAFKYTSTRVACTIREEGLTIIVEIVDDGPGLGDADIAHVLRPGHRLDEQVPGFGFGLPIARELAELYGGELKLIAQESGLKVTLRLPRANS